MSTIGFNSSLCPLPGGIREPCNKTECRYHIAGMKSNRNTKREAVLSCSLVVAEIASSHGGLSPETIAEACGLTRQRIDQLIIIALKRFQLKIKYLRVLW